METQPAAPICTVCNRSIPDGTPRVFLGDHLQAHESCTCVDCGKPLDGTIIEAGGYRYCESCGSPLSDYWRVTISPIAPFAVQGGFFTNDARLAWDEARNRDGLIFERSYKQTCFWEYIGKRDGVPEVKVAIRKLLPVRLHNHWVAADVIAPNLIRHEGIDYWLVYLSNNKRVYESRDGNQTVEA